MRGESVGVAASDEHFDVVVIGSGPLEAWDSSCERCCVRRASASK
jgi:hypothetical protein